MTISFVYNSLEEKEKRIVKYLEPLGLKLNFLDIQKLNSFKETGKSDCFLFLLPEEKSTETLQRFISYSKDEIKKKPAGIVSYSSHLSFNKTGVDAFTLALLSIQAFPVKISMRIVVAVSGILENGNIKELLKEVKWWAKVFRNEKANSKLTVRIKKTNREEYDVQNTDSLESLLGSNYWKN